MGTRSLPVVFLLIVGAVSGQQSYGPPGYQPGIPIGSDGDAIVKTEGYEIPDSRSSGYRGGPSSSLLSSAISDSVSLSYGAPSARSESYGAPSQPASNQAYGVPGIGSGKPLTSYKNALDNARYQIVPESSLPEQHSNLIRYIVLKEFAVSPNGTITPMDPEGVSLIGKTALTAGGGRGSGEVEILKVQMPGSGETGSSQSSGAGASNVAYGPPGYPAGKPNGDDNNDLGDEDDDYDGDNNGEDYDEGDYDEDGNVDNNSVSGGEMQRTAAASGMASFMQGAASGEGMQVFPARGVALNNARRQSQENKPVSSETEAFMFSDPNSGETTSSRRQSTASFNVNSPSLNINAQAQSGGVRNALRNAGNRIRPNRNRNNRNRNRNRNRANRNRNRSNNRNRGTQNRVIGGAPASSAAAATSSEGSSGGAASMASQMAEIQSALNLISTYLEQMKQAGRPSSSLAAPGAGLLSAALPFTNSGGGPYPASGQSARGASSGSASAASSSSSSSSSGSSSSGNNNDAIVITSESPATPTQTTFPASTYGPPPGTAGFSLQAGSVFPQVADAITRPLQQAAGLKSSLVTTLVNGLSNGIRNIGAQASAAAATNSASTPSPVYGAPSATATNPLGLLRAFKGGVVNTVANKGRAAVGIVGTKGQLVVKQVGTGANLVSKGLSQTLANKHEAIQGVINHITSIFQSNPNLLNSGTAYGSY